MRQEPPQIFDERRIRKLRQRSGGGFSNFNFLHQRVEQDIVDRLETVTRQFPLAVFEGADSIPAELTEACGIENAIYVDSVAARLPNDAPRVIASPAAPSFHAASLDLHVSILVHHAVNDLIGSLAQIRSTLKPDGLMISALLGENTLGNLRQSLYRAETEVTGGVSARIAPFATIQDLGQATTRAGFALPVIDIDKVEVTYKNAQQLLYDLRGMGFSAPLKNRAPTLRRDVLHRAMEIFAEDFGAENFDVIYLTGWAPHESQQKPLKPGSATTSLEQAIRKSGQG